MNTPIILASGSPQREKLLRDLGIHFRVVVPTALDESSHPEHAPAKRAQELARLKAEEVGAKHKNAWIIGCDTLVVAPDGSLLEKPQSRAEAERMIALQSGGTSIVHSGLCVRTPRGKYLTDLSSSSVTFKKLTQREIRSWLSTKLWVGRSGAFQIDGLGQLLIERIEGDWTSVVGLPVFLLETLFKRAGTSLFTILS